MSEHRNPDVEPDDVNLSEVRRHGWTVRTLSRAVAALTTELGSVPADRPLTTDEELVRELIRWLDIAVRKDHEKEQPDYEYAGRALFTADLNAHGRGLPPVLPRHAALAEILTSPGPSPLGRLREAYDDPTHALIDLANDLTPAEWSGDDKLPGPHRAALRALADLGTFEAIRFLVERLGGKLPSEEVCEITQQALDGAGASLLEPALVLWPSASESARARIVEALCKAGVRDDRFFARLIDWIEEDEYSAVLALGDYGDSRAVPHLRRLLDRARARGADRMANEILESLTLLGASPTEETADVGA